MAPPAKPTPEAARRRIREGMTAKRRLRLSDLNLIKEPFADLYREAMEYCKAKPADTSADPADTPGTSTPKTRKRKQRPQADDESEVTQTKRVVHAKEQSKALLGRWQTIDDGEPEAKEDIGEQIGEHQVPIGVLRYDPNPKRTVFASIRTLGDIDITVFPLDKRFVPIDVTDEHENVFESYVSSVRQSQWLLDNIIFDVRSGIDDYASLRKYVFQQLQKTEEGRERIAGWATDTDIKGETRPFQVRRINAMMNAESPPKDPWKSLERNLSLGTFYRQAMVLLENEENTDLAEARSKLEDEIRSCDSFEDTNQCGNVKEALLDLMEAIEKQRAKRDLTYYEQRANPSLSPKRPVNAPEQLLTQLITSTYPINQLLTKKQRREIEELSRAEAETIAVTPDTEA